MKPLKEHSKFPVTDSEVEIYELLNKEFKISQIIKTSLRKMNKMEAS
jgi:hypothetical protein